LAQVYSEYFRVKDDIARVMLERKSRPAPKAAEAVRESSAEKRHLAYRLKIAEQKIRNYELVAPYLTEFDDETPAEEDEWVFEDYTEEEAQDMATRYLTKDEYRRLPPSERNQLALDRYWSRRKKSRATLGKIYERYVGYLYEENGYSVEYFGIKRRYEDEGKDLIASKDGNVHIVQCKNWSRYKTIYENHVFQLFGTSYDYQLQHPQLRVTPVFFAATGLGERAKVFADRLDVEVRDNFELKPYPCIKCNVSYRTNERIYHLPFDQQYDNTTIEEERLEQYVATVKEAEALGFRRAFRWRGTRET
jgi:hypothetical protein